MWYKKFRCSSYFTELSTSLIPLWKMFYLNNETVIGSFWALDFVTSSPLVLDLVTNSIWAMDLVGLKSYLSLIYKNAWDLRIILKTHKEQFNSKIKEEIFMSRTKKMFSLSKQNLISGQGSLWTIICQCKINAVVLSELHNTKLCYTTITQSYKHIIFAHTHQQHKVTYYHNTTHQQSNSYYYLF